MNKTDFKKPKEMKIIENKYKVNKVKSKKVKKIFAKPKNVNKLNLEKYGFIRDIRNDECEYDCYDYKGLKVLYCYEEYEGRYFQQFNLKNPTFEEYEFLEDYFTEVYEINKKLKRAIYISEIESKFTEENLKQLINDLDQVINEKNKFLELIEHLKQTRPIKIYSLNKGGFVILCEGKYNYPLLKPISYILSKVKELLKLGFKFEECKLVTGETKEIKEYSEIDKLYKYSS